MTPSDTFIATPQTSTSPDPATPARRLDRKLASIAAGRYTPDDFVVADAKDADMAFGVQTAGPLPTGPGPGVGPGRYRTRPSYLDSMRAIAGQGVVDILLTSASNGEILTEDGAITGGITLAVRANDTTDIWNQRGGIYPTQPSRPFRTVRLPAIRPWCDLVLYSVTFNNDLERDLATVEAYGDFRAEAAENGIRHFLEVFSPNAPKDLSPRDVGAFVNDSVLRTLAGVTRAERPVFLKMAYTSGAALAELVENDPTVVVGILGGSAGTTRDMYELLTRAEQHGARVSLFGRKIQHAESQLDLVGLIPAVLRGDLVPAQAVRAYHDALAAAGIAPQRPLEADLEVTEPALLAE